MKRKSLNLVVFMVSILLSFNLVLANDFTNINTSSNSVHKSFILDEINSGTVKINYPSNRNKRLKVLIKHNESNTSYSYDLNLEGKTEHYPLQMGNGNYTISILEHKNENNYSFIDSIDIYFSADIENSVYLNSIQNINWKQELECIDKASKLSENKTSNIAKAKQINQFIVENFKYDYNKEKILGYIPSISKTLYTKNGICYDFASLFAGMLRSQGVPTKLVMGYSNNAIGYHAWNEVYDEMTQSWVIVDTTFNISIYEKKSIISFESNQKDYNRIERIY